MPGLANFSRWDQRTRTVGVLVAAAALVAALAFGIPTAARATGCTDSWTNATGGSWLTGTNWSTGEAPASTEEACITLEGTYTVTLDGAETTVKSLTLGASSGTQTLSLGSTCSINELLTAVSGVGIGAHGVLTMTNSDGCADSVAVAAPVTNAGAIDMETEKGGNRSLEGNVTNTGTIAVNTGKAFFNGTKATVTNEGALDVGEGDRLQVEGASAFTNGTGGKIAAGKTGVVFLEPGASYTQGAGTTSGTEPVVLEEGALAYTGSGASAVSARSSSTISGKMATGQSLEVQSTCSKNVTLTAASGFSSAGSITVTNADGCADSATLSIPTGTFTNTGTLTSEKAKGGGRGIDGNVLNTGTIAVNTATSLDQAAATFANEGALNIAESVQLHVFGGTSLVNGTGGSINAGAGGDLLFEASSTPEGSFTEGAGTTMGTLPVIVENGPIAYTGSGASLIAARGTDALSGNLAAGQQLQVQSTCSRNAVLTAFASYTNAGSITLTNGDGCASAATLATSAGALTNSGAITTVLNKGGARTLQGSLDNKGTLAIDANTAYNGASGALVNEGALEVATETSLTVSNSSTVTDAAKGVVAAAGSGHVFLDPGTSYTQGAGATSGIEPVIVEEGSLAYTSSGAGSVDVRGTSTLSGNLAGGQKLTLQSTCSKNVTLTAAASYTNGGSITLTNGDGCGDGATLTTSSGTLTNSGTITTERNHGGARALLGSLRNTGTLAIGQTTTASASGATLTNEGTLHLATEVALNVTGGTTVANESGTIAATGSGELVESAGTFDQGAGKTSGTTPVVLENTALHYTGKGTGPLAVRGEGGTLSGTINAGQTLAIQSTCSLNARPKAAAAFTSSGTLVLTNGDGCGNKATLNMNGETLTNKGTISAERAHGGTREIEGSVKNEKIVLLGAGITLTITGTYTHGKSGQLKDTVESGQSFGQLSASGAATLAGKLAIVKPKKGFAPSVGTSWTILSSAARSGAFTKESSATIVNKAEPGLYLRPVYLAMGVGLVVTQAKLTATPSEGAPSSTVKLTGANLPAEDTITLTFTDAKKAKTTLPSVKTNASGEFSTEVGLPGGAAAGSGKFTGKSKFSAVSQSATFKVT